MNFRDLLDQGSDDILDLTEKYKTERRRKEMEETSDEDFCFEDFSGDMTSSEDFSKDTEHFENSDEDTIIIENFKEDTDSLKDLSGDTDFFENFEKREVKKGGFDLLEYGLPVVNAHHGFSYNSSYRIPFERYLEVFGPSFTFHMYLQHSMGTWGGNCFGMAVVSILTYLKKINLGDYQRKGVPLADTAYDHIYSADFGSYCCLDKTSELTKLIERYYILQFSDHVIRLRQKAVPIMEREPERIQRFFNSIYRDRIPYMLAACWVTEGEIAGHAMVVDSSRDPEELGNGWHRIYLYDPNNPYHMFAGQAPAYYYKQAENRYIDVNVVTGDWHMSAVVNADGGSSTKWDTIGSDTGRNNGYISFINCESFQSNFMEKAGVHSSYGSAVQALRYETDDMEIYDLKGTRLCTVTNGVLIDCQDERICNLPVLGRTVDGINGGNCGTLVLPDEPVTVKFSSGFIGMFSSDTYAGCVSEDAVTVCFRDEGNMEISSDEPAMVNVVVKAGEGEHFVSYMTDINVSNEPGRVLLQGMSLYIDTDNDQEIDVSIITESGVSEEKEVSVVNGALIKGRDRSRVYTNTTREFRTRVLEACRKKEREVSK